MPSQKYTSGYCSNCCKNVPHLRSVNNPLLRILDELSLHAFGLFRVGPWYCVHCDLKVIVLPPSNPSAMEYHSAALDREYPVQEVPPAFRPPQTSTHPTAFTPPSTTQPDTEMDQEFENAVPVGNYLRSESSLLMKTTRLNRFSEKYRDAIVRRILAGNTTFAHVRQDKHLSEAELTEWIADLLERQQKRISTLEYAIRSIPSLEHLTNSDDSTIDESHSDGAVLRPR